jgi:hypothetical protein
LTSNLTSIIVISSFKYKKWRGFAKPRIILLLLLLDYIKLRIIAGTTCFNTEVGHEIN